MEISISYLEVNEWMTKRKHLKEDWSKKLKAAKLQAKELLEQNKNTTYTNIKDEI